MFSGANKTILKTLLLLLSVSLWAHDCGDWLSLKLLPLPDHISPISDQSSMDQLRSRYSPYFLRKKYLEISNTKFFVVVDTKKSDELLPPPNQQILEVFPEELRAAFLQRLFLISNLDQLTDTAGTKKEWFNDFRNWVTLREADIFNPKVLISQLEDNENLGSFYARLKLEFNEVHRNRMRSGLSAYLDKEDSRWGRFWRSSKYKSTALLVKYRKWIPVAVLGLGVYFVGVDLLRTNLTNEVKYHMVEGRTDLATQVQLALNEKSYLEREAALKDFKGDVKKLHSETSRVLSSIPGLSPDQASRALYNLEKGFARYQWATERFLSRTLVQGRGDFVYNQLDFPHSWMQRINVSYGIFIQIRESLDRYNFDLKRLEIEAKEKAGSPSELALNKMMEELNVKIKALKVDLEFHRKQTAVAIATWKIYEMIFAEFLIHEPGNDQRGLLYHNEVRALGFAYYLETFQEQFEKEAQELGFIFETGKITESLKEKINLNFTEPTKTN
jgi:hypothetical protein